MEISLDTIMERCSVRSYAGKALSPDQSAFLERAFAEAVASCPYGNRPRFMLAGPGFVQEDGTGNTPTSFKIGTYGLIKNPPAFIIGAVSAGPGAVIDYGYALEGIILAATAAGLGTCWLGGTFDRTATKDLVSLQEGELIPAISPVGVPAVKRSLTERTMRFIAGSDSRKPWDQLFFDGQPGKPLAKADAGAWAPVLEAVRMGPSASNKQPWRILREGPARFSLLFAEDRAYNTALGIPIQELDLGIAMRHFELAARACGLPGQWLKDSPQVPANFPALASGSGKVLSHIARWDS
jgi:hypothetical protein